MDTHAELTAEWGWPGSKDREETTAREDESRILERVSILGCLNHSPLTSSVSAIQCSCLLGAFYLGIVPSTLGTHITHAHNRHS